MRLLRTREEKVFAILEYLRVHGETLGSKLRRELNFTLGIYPLFS